MIRLEPFAPDLKEEVRAVVDCDPEASSIMPFNPTGAGFEGYWVIEENSLPFLYGHHRENCQKDVEALDIVSVERFQRLEPFVLEPSHSS